MIPFIWSLAEICVAIICACLPAIRTLVTHSFPKLFSTIAKSFNSSNNSTIKSSGNNSSYNYNDQKVQEKDSKANLNPRAKLNPYANLDYFESPPITSSASIKNDAIDIQTNIDMFSIRDDETVSDKTDVVHTQNRTFYHQSDEDSSSSDSLAL